MEFKTCPQPNSGDGNDGHEHHIDPKDGESKEETQDHTTVMTHVAFSGALCFRWICHHADRKEMAGFLDSI